MPYYQWKSQWESLTLHYRPANSTKMISRTGISRKGISPIFKVPLFILLIISGLASILVMHFSLGLLIGFIIGVCSPSPDPPNEEWLRKNFQTHESAFNEIATITLSVPIDDYFVYPGYICDDSITRNERDSIYFAELGETKRATLDSLLQVVNCIDVRVSPIDQKLSLTTYRFGSLRGWSVNYYYLVDRPSSITFVEDKDLYEAFLYWQGDKSHRPWPRKALDGYWHLEYFQ